MEGIDPFSWRSISSQRARLDRQRDHAEQAQTETKPQRSRSHHWPRPAAFSDAISALLGRYEPTGPGPQHQSLPTPVDSKPW